MKFPGIRKGFLSVFFSRIQRGQNTIAYGEILKYADSKNSADIMAHHLVEKYGATILFEGKEFKNWEDGIR
jgi:hypothetical protein